MEIPILLDIPWKSHALHVLGSIKEFIISLYHSCVDMLRLKICCTYQVNNIFHKFSYTVVRSVQARNGIVLARFGHRLVTS
jgi:hypothetical protein